MGTGRTLPEDFGRDIKSSSPESSVEGFGLGGSTCAELVEESKSQLSSVPGDLGLEGCEDEKEEVPARESSPAQASVLRGGTTGCWITCALAFAAFSAMVSLELLEPLPNEPESRSPNASPDVMAVAPLLEPWAGGVAVDDGVWERGLDEFELEAASIEKASYFGRIGAVDDGAGLAPSLRGGCEGFRGAEEFQRSAKESAMAVNWYRK